MPSRKRRRPNESEIVDASALGLVHDVKRDDARPSPSSPDASSSSSSSAAYAASSTVPPDASTALALRDERTLWGSRAFFERAAEELIASTRIGQELAGAALARQREGRIVLVGLQRLMSGKPGNVAIDPTWGGVLWHTHPGLRGSLAAFSNDDLEVARNTRKPLLVIGFSGLSLDVVSTLALPFGVRSLVASAGIKGVLALARSGRIPDTVLALGVAARVCWPSGLIQPVLRVGATPLQAAVDDMAFVVDRGVGAVERVGQKALRGVLGAISDVTRRR